jgi:hypothetical protein
LKYCQFTIAVILACTSTPTLAKQPFETETARLPKQGHGNIQFEFEYATSDDGRDIAAPIVLEYGITNRLKLVIEPDVYASVKPKSGAAVNGFGDTEAKLVYLISEESGAAPALAIAGEVKIPTGKRPDLSSGKVDYRIFAIVSKRAGRFDLHANLGYTIVGSPVGEKLPNVIDYSVAAEYAINPKFSLVSEILGSSPLGGSNGGVLASNVEVEGTVITGLVGAIYKVRPKTEFALAATYDSGSLLLIRAGLTFRF